MKKNQKTDKNNSLRMGLLFCAIVGLIITISLAYKAFVIVKQSIYEKDHRFTFLIQPKGKEQEIVSIDSVNKKMVRLLIRNTSETASAARLLNIPVDATVKNSSAVRFSDPVSLQLRAVMLNYPQVKTTMTLFDLGRLYLLTKTIVSEDTVEKTITLPVASESLDKFISDNLSDVGITQDNQTIQIINASGVSGVGSRVEKVITRIGGSVISVTTARENEKQSTIEYVGEKSYSVAKLEQFFSLPSKQTTEKKISDIIITLGEDNKLTN